VSHCGNVTSALKSAFLTPDGFKPGECNTSHDSFSATSRLYSHARAKLSFRTCSQAAASTRLADLSTPTYGINRKELKIMREMTRKLMYQVSAGPTPPAPVTAIPTIVRTAPGRSFQRLGLNAESTLALQTLVEGTWS
jgi:hypothetical protein